MNEEEEEEEGCVLATNRLINWRERWLELAETITMVTLGKKSSKMRPVVILEHSWRDYGCFKINICRRGKMDRLIIVDNRIVIVCLLIIK